MDAGYRRGWVLDLPRQWGGGVVTVTGMIERLFQSGARGRTIRSMSAAPARFREPFAAAEARELGIRFERYGRAGGPTTHAITKSLWYVLSYSLPRMERCDPLCARLTATISASRRFYQIAG